MIFVIPIANSKTSQIFNYNNKDDHNIHDVSESKGSSNEKTSYEYRKRKDKEICFCTIIAVDLFYQLDLT